ncbi:MAG: hypothetical protein ACR2QU_05945 [Gammaproteobacteria bacterium]
MNSPKLLIPLALAAILILPGLAGAEPPETVNGITTIHLDEYNGYFAAQETLAGLKPGTYRFVISNKADKLVGFWLQDGVTHKLLEKFPLEPGQTRSTTVTITENGFRYRCPINPTPWYDVAIG